MQTNSPRLALLRRRFASLRVASALASIAIPSADFAKPTAPRKTARHTTSQAAPTPADTAPADPYADESARIVCATVATASTDDSTLDADFATEADSRIAAVSDVLPCALSPRFDCARLSNAERSALRADVQAYRIARDQVKLATPALATV